MPEETSRHLLLGAQDQRLGMQQDQFPSGSTGTSFRHLSRYRNLLGFCMSHATTASPNQSFGAFWRVGDAVVGRGNAGWTTSKSGHCCPCQNCSQWPPAEKTGIESLLNRPSCPPDDPIGQGTELNCIRVLHSPATVTTLYNIPVPFCTDCVCVCVCACVCARAPAVCVRVSV